MEKLFVPYNLALKLKEMGYNERCLGTYLDRSIYPEFDFPALHRNDLNSDMGRPFYPQGISCSAPLWQQAFDWFERYNLYGRVDPTRDGWYYYILEKNNEGSHDKKTFYNNFSSDKKWCQVACLEKLIEIIKNGGKIICTV